MADCDFTGIMDAGSLDFVMKEFDKGVPITDRVRKAVVDLFDMLWMLGDGEGPSDSQIAGALVDTFFSSSIERGEYNCSLDGRICTGSITLGDEVRVSIPNLRKWGELFDALRESDENKETERSESD